MSGPRNVVVGPIVSRVAGMAAEARNEQMGPYHRSSFVLAYAGPWTLNARSTAFASSI